jgi:hypothetical protein
VTGTSLENLTIFGGSLFVDRLLFVTGTSAAVRDVNLYNNDATSISFRGGGSKGGTGLYAFGGEGCLFENVGIFRCQLGHATWRTTFIHTRGRECYKVLKSEVDSTRQGRTRSSRRGVVAICSLAPNS